MRDSKKGEKTDFDKTSYHQRELSIALDPSHPAHILPPPRSPEDKILDIGCGAGQTLAVAYPNHRTWGIDPDFDAVAYARVVAPNAKILCGRARELPWSDETFDFVIARVSLPYTNIPLALSEIYRVLKPGGGVWITLHTFLQVWNQAKRANWKGRVFFLYIVLNSIYLRFSGKVFSFFGKYESFQTRSGFERTLSRAGLKVSSIRKCNYFVVEAYKQRLQKESTSILP